jgi:hypothetical protein
MFDFLKREIKSMKKPPSLIALCSLIIAALTIGSSPLHGASNDNEEEELRLIVRTAIQSHVDEGMHQQLWSYVAKQSPKFAEELILSSTLMPEFNRETWVSAALSAQTGNAEYTKDYPRLLKEVLRAGLLRDDTLQKELIEAAIDRGTLDHQGSLISITPALIDQTISQLDYATLRLRRLFTPQWFEGPLAVSYPSLGLQILTTHGFERWSVETQMTDGKTALVKGLTHLDGDSKTEVWVGPNNPDYSGLSPTEIAEHTCDLHWKLSRGDYAIELIDAVVEPWQQYISVVDAAQLSNDKAVGQERVRCVYLHDTDQIMVMATSLQGKSRSLDAAGSAFEESITVIRAD